MHLFPFIWAYGHHFRTKDVDDGHMTQDCGVEVEFDLLVVEPDYLLDLEVFCFNPFLYPMKTLHPRRLYTPPHGGVGKGGLAPPTGSGRVIPLSGGSGGKWASEETFPYKYIL